MVDDFDDLELAQHLQLQDVLDVQFGEEPSLFRQSSEDEGTESDEDYQPATKKHKGSPPQSLAPDVLVEPAVGKKQEHEDSDEDTDLDEDGLLIQEAMNTAHQMDMLAAMDSDTEDETTKLPLPKPKIDRKPRATRPGGGVSLRQIVEAGVLEPGEDILRCEYKGQLSLGTLTSEGRIEWNGQVFESPSAWSIHLKRLVTPNRKADDGWKTIRCHGKYLEHYKIAYRNLQAGEGEAAGAERQLPQQPQQPVTNFEPAAAVKLEKESVQRKVSQQQGTKSNTSNVTELRAKYADLLGHSSLPEANGRSSAEASTTEPTDYSRNRPKREVKVPERLVNLQMRRSGDSHEMVPCQPYVGVPGGGETGSQPFAIEISSSAQLVMDLHAHLSLCEVIGLLAGSFCPVKRRIVVERVYPVLEVSTEDDSVNVEMDPEDQLRVVSKIQSDGGQCVGWYHSHPDFPTIPSRIDIENQTRYQEMHRQAENGQEPYIAAIVGPFMKSLPTPVSEISWFYVSHPPGSNLEFGQDPLNRGYVPRSLHVESSINGSELSEETLSELSRVIARYSSKFQTRTSMFNTWRSNSTLLDKLQISLEARLPQSWAPVAKQLLASKVVAMVREAWHAREVTVETDAPSVVGEIGMLDRADSEETQ